jgi:hypothetical protein
MPCAKIKPVQRLKMTPGIKTADLSRTPSLHENRKREKHVNAPRAHPKKKFAVALDPNERTSTRSLGQGFLSYRHTTACRQFLAACVELRQAAGNSEHLWNSEHLTRLPITMDASNSGLQHLSAMVRCEIGGRCRRKRVYPVSVDSRLLRQSCAARWSST